MKRNYPYLHDRYFTNTETEDKVSRSILRDIEEFVNQRQYIRLTLLDWKENPIREIQGEVTSGSLSKVAQSPVRRSGNLSIAVDAGSYSVDDAEADFAINKKIYIELGVRNDTDKYPDYPIFWFPEGVFFIGSFAINSSSSGTTNINLTLKDKMAMLNGEIGGVLPAMVTFDTVETQLPDGTYANKKVLIYTIIQELVNHYGKENLTNIVIEDVPMRIRRVLKWAGSQPLYLKWKTGTATQEELQEIKEEDDYWEDTNKLDLANDGYRPWFSLTKPESENEDTWECFYAGDDIGYVRENFVIAKELVGNAGETVCNILDKIINILGNYEYFYDVYGIFHFREIKNYMNHTLGEKVLSELAEKDYLVDTNNSKNVFSFSDETLLTSITVTPLYENIKNDFIIDGLAKNESTGVNRNIRYHLAIDTKPRPIGIDKRDYLKILWDREEDIKKVKEDINFLNDRLDILRDEKSRALANIEVFKRRKLQRYDYLRRYGDELKRKLTSTLGVFSIPNDQEIVSSNANNKVLKPKDFYENSFEKLVEEIKKQNKKKSIDINSYLNKWDHRMIELVESNIEIENNVEMLKKFSERIYDFLTPEGYWKLVKTGILQQSFNKEKRKEYKTQSKAWNEALAKVLEGITIKTNLENAFLALGNNSSDGTYQNPINGYTKISNECIKTDRKVLVRMPKDLQTISANSLPQTLTEIFIKNESGSKYQYNKNTESIIKNIYSEYYSSLVNNSDEEALNLKQCISTRKDIRTKKLNIESKRQAAKKLKKHWIKYNPKNKKTIKSYAYYSYELKDDENNSVNIKKNAGFYSNKILTFQKVENKILECTKKYNDLALQEKELTKTIKDLRKKTQKEHFKEIWKYLLTSWEKYEDEKNIIKETDDKIKEYQRKYKQNTKMKIGEIYTLIEGLSSKDIYYGLEVSKNKIPTFPYKKEENDFIIDDIFLNTLSSEQKAAILLTIDQFLKKHWTKDDRIDQETVYTNLISLLEGILRFWEQNPNYIKIRNLRKGDPVYHVFTDRTMVLYKEPNTEIIKAGFVYSADKDKNMTGILRRPTVGNFNLIYPGETEDDLGYYYWDGKVYQPLETKGIFFCKDTLGDVDKTDIRKLTAQDLIKNNTDLDDVGAAYYIYDWRTFLYLQGLYAKINGTDKGHYFEELEAFWPETYNLLEQRFYGQPEKEEQSNLFPRTKFTEAYYFLDFLDGVGTTFGKWSVDNIGRRSDVVHNEEINCLFEPEIPNINIFNVSNTSLIPDKEHYSLEDDWSLNRLRKESIDNGEPYTQVNDDIYDHIYSGGYRNSAYEQIKYELYLHTRYQKTISMSSIPVFYLEPNSRISVADTTTNTFGDFIIQSINLTFGPGANMSISANETLERF